MKKKTSKQVASWEKNMFHLIQSGHLIQEPESE